jgi:hypothetical protein
LTLEPPADELDHKTANTHCFNKIIEISALDSPNRRDLLQLGFNLGRLSEIHHLGRTFWDDWKEPVNDWDRSKLITLTKQLHQFLSNLEENQ